MVERTFASQKPITEGNRGSDKDEATEVGELKVKNDLQDDEIDKVIDLAQRKWVKLLRPSRCSGSENRKPQIRKGISLKDRDHTQDGCLVNEVITNHQLNYQATH